MKSASKNTEPQFYSTAAWRRPHSTPSGLGSNSPGSLVKAPPLTNAASIVTLLRPLVPTAGLRFSRVIMPLTPCQQQQQQKIYKKQKKYKNKLAPAWLPRLHNTINTIKFHFYSAHFPVKCQLISRDKGFTVTVDPPPRRTENTFPTISLKHSNYNFHFQNLLIGGNLSIASVLLQPTLLWIHLAHPSGKELVQSVYQEQAKLGRQLDGSFVWHSRLANAARLDAPLAAWLQLLCPLVLQRLLLGLHFLFLSFSYLDPPFNTSASTHTHNQHKHRQRQKHFWMANAATLCKMWLVQKKENKPEIIIFLQY